MGLEPVPGLPQFVTHIHGTGLILAGASQAALRMPDVMAEMRRRGNYAERRNPQTFDFASEVLRVEDGEPPHSLARVMGLHGLADAGDGRQAFIVYEAAPTGASQGPEVLGLIDAQTGEIVPVPGATGIPLAGDAPLVVARDGYAWVRVVTDNKGCALLRVSAKGVVETMLTAQPSTPGLDLWPVAPGPAGEALLVARGKFPGCPGDTERIVRLGKAAPRVIAVLRPANRAGTSDSASWPDGWRGIGWPPEEMRDAEAVVVFFHHYMTRVLVVQRGASPFLVCPYASERGAEVDLTRASKDAGGAPTASAEPPVLDCGLDGMLPR